MYLRDAGAARSALVRGSDAKPGDLHDVEVLEQADPHDAGEDVQPAREPELVEPGRRDQEHERSRR